MPYTGPEIEGHKLPCSHADESRLALDLAPGAQLCALHVWRSCVLLLQTKCVITNFMNFQLKVFKKLKSTVHLSASECCSNICDNVLHVVSSLF